MQTFLPVPSFVRSASLLDYRRLGKQRVEAYQIIRILTGVSNARGWTTHPAVKMWDGYSPLLMSYFNACVDEWVRRGYKNTMSKYNIGEIPFCPLPWWHGDEEFHKSHQSNLVRKDPEFYSVRFPGVPPDLPYLWPENETRTFRVIESKSKK